jgi:RNA polymerase sigma factor (sigma-70 family)
VWNKPLEKLESEDFYNAAIIGLYRAVLKVKEEETENILVSKIIFYTNIEIAHWAKKPREKPFSSSSIEDNVEKWPPWVVGVWSGGCAKQFYDEPMHENLEREFVWDRFEKLVKEGVLETEDFNLLVMRFVEDLTYRDIAKIVGYSSKTVSRKIESIMCRIRWEWRRRRWGDDL